MKTVFVALFVGSVCLTTVVASYCHSATVRAAEPDRADNEEPYALIYSGPAAGDGCPEAVAAIARQAGLPVRNVEDLDEIPDLLGRAAVLIIGGTTGDLEDFRRSFTPQTERAVKSYLLDGGRYWGICGGAYVAAERFGGNEGPVKALKLIPAIARDHSDGEAKLETVRLRGKKRDLYLQGSPKFVITDREAGVEIIARFEDDSVAALQCAYGKGKVAVSGPHPEANESWLTHDNLETKGWQPTGRLAVEMLKDLLSDQPIPRKSK